MYLYSAFMGFKKSNLESAGKPSDEASKPPLVRARVEGAVGSLLLISSMVPFLGAALGVAGFILILSAAKRISQTLGNMSIFEYMRVAAILGIFGVGAEAGWMFPSISAHMGIPTICPSCPTTHTTFATGFAIMLTWILTMASAIHLRKSVGLIALSLGVKAFRVAALLYLISAILIIAFIGFFILPIAQISLAIAFMLMPRQMSGSPPPLPQQGSQPQTS